MKNIMPHLDKYFFVVCEGMLAYDDGNKVRKNRKFLKALWEILRYEKRPSSTDTITIEDVIIQMGDTVAESTKQMVQSNIKRGGWRWLEGERGDIFGERFIDEYVRRCEIIKKEELIRVAGRMIDQINHNNYPDLYPAPE